MSERREDSDDDCWFRRIIPSDKLFKQYFWTMTESEKNGKTKDARLLAFRSNSKRSRIKKRYKKLPEDQFKHQWKSIKASSEWKCTKKRGFHKTRIMRNWNSILSTWQPLSQRNYYYLFYVLPAWGCTSKGCKDKLIRVLNISHGGQHWALPLDITTFQPHLPRRWWWIMNLFYRIRPWRYTDETSRAFCSGLQRDLLA